MKSKTKVAAKTGATKNLGVKKPANPMTGASTVIGKSSKSDMKQLKSEADGDIIKLILDDHKPLKSLIETLKDWDSELAERKEAFEEFSLLLTTHAHAEKEALYKVIERNENLAKEGYEGEVEHSLAIQTLEAAMDDETEETWSAKVKVLAELVQHHIEEEETHMLPDYKKQSTAEERARLGIKYRILKKKNQHAEEHMDLDEDEDSDSRDQNLVGTEEVRSH